MKLALWSPQPRAGGLGAIVGRLEQQVSLELYTGSGPAPDAELHLFHVDDSPAHAFVLRALREQPGVVVLAEWNLHRVAREEALSLRGYGAYLHEARRSHGQAGAFAARQGILGNDSAILRSLFPLNDRMLEGTLGMVACTRLIAAHARPRLLGRPVRHVPIGLAAAAREPLDRNDARTAAGLDGDGAVVVALEPRTGEQRARTADALTDLGGAARNAVLRWTHEDDPGGEALVAGADVVVALEHPPRASLHPLVVTAMAAARPVLVSAAGAAVAEFAAGAVVPVSPGTTEKAEVRAVVERLLEDPPLSAQIGRLARREVLAGSDPEALATRILDLARTVAGDLPSRLAAWKAARPDEGTPLANALEKVRWAARDLGLGDLPLDLKPQLSGLFDPAPGGKDPHSAGE